MRSVALDALVASLDELAYAITSRATFDDVSNALLDALLADKRTLNRVRASVVLARLLHNRKGVESYFFGACFSGTSLLLRELFPRVSRGLEQSFSLSPALSSGATHNHPFMTAAHKGEWKGRCGARRVGVLARKQAAHSREDTSPARLGPISGPS